MLQVQCPGCLTQGFLDCACPPGHVTTHGAHHQACPLADIDGQVTCGCCPQDHDHAAAANACPGGHPCPDPGGCAVYAGEGDCPGGHCGKDIPGCTVCRPLIITVIPGGTSLKPAFGVPGGN